MALKTLVLYVVAMMAVQCVVIIVVTRRNKDIMDQFKDANGYSLAIKELAKHRPLSALAIRLCYMACLVELLIVIVAKYW